MTPVKSNTSFDEGHKSKGILDDYAVRATIDTKEGTIQHNPSNPKDILNKEYVDNPLPAKDSGNTVSYEDTDFVVGDSPIILNIEADLGHKSSQGYFVNDGSSDNRSGDILMAYSEDGITFTDDFIMHYWGEKINFTPGDTISKIRLTHVEDSSYRALFI